jgi:hypothetical protein
VGRPPCAAPTSAPGGEPSVGTPPSARPLAVTAVADRSFGHRPGRGRERGGAVRFHAVGSWDIMSLLLRTGGDP